MKPQKPPREVRYAVAALRKEAARIQCALVDERWQKFSRDESDRTSVLRMIFNVLSFFFMPLIIAIFLSKSKERTYTGAWEATLETPIGPLEVCLLAVGGNAVGVRWMTKLDARAPVEMKLDCTRGLHGQMRKWMPIDESDAFLVNFEKIASHLKAKVKKKNLPKMYGRLGISSFFYDWLVWLEPEGEQSRVAFQGGFPKWGLWRTEVGLVRILNACEELKSALSELQAVVRSPADQS